MNSPSPRRSPHDQFTAALAFDRAIRVRGAQRHLAFDGGVAIRHDGLRDKYVLNSLLFDSPLGPALHGEQLVTLADQHLTGLGHRYVVIDDGAGGERLAAELEPLGWSVQRTLLMALRHPPDRAPRAGVARPLTDPELGAHLVAMTLEERGPSAVSLAATLADGEAALRAGTRSIGFGAGEDGRVECSCTLFLDVDQGVALIDEVATLSAARGRGLARAAVSAAIAVARQEGCSDIFVPADAEDWPKALYGRMGFEQIGLQVSLLLILGGVGINP